MSIDANTFRKAAAFIADWQRVLIVAHERLDGDAVGGLVSLSQLLKANSQQPTPCAFGNVPARYESIASDTNIIQWPGMSPEELASRYDGMIVVDTCTAGQMEPLQEILKEKPIPVLAIDHHVTRDEGLADCCLIDPTASSASLIILEWALACGWQIDMTSAQALFAGMATDTGWFRFSNADARTLRAAATLIEMGVKQDVLYQQLYLADSPARMRLLGRVLTDMELQAQGRLAVMTVTLEMMKQCKALPPDVEDMINESQRIGSVDTSMLLMEREDGVIKVGLRSKHLLNVAEIAQRFGGGGHVKAAGLRISGNISQVKEQLTTVLVEALQKEAS